MLPWNSSVVFCCIKPCSLKCLCRKSFHIKVFCALSSMCLPVTFAFALLLFDSQVASHEDVTDAPGSVDSHAACRNLPTDLLGQVLAEEESSVVLAHAKLDEVTLKHQQVRMSGAELRCCDMQPTSSEAGANLEVIMIVHQDLLNLNLNIPQPILCMPNQACLQEKMLKQIIFSITIQHRANFLELSSDYRCVELRRSDMGAAILVLSSDVPVEPVHVNSQTKWTPETKNSFCCLGWEVVLSLFVRCPMSCLGFLFPAYLTTYVSHFTILQRCTRCLRCLSWFSACPVPFFMGRHLSLAAFCQTSCPSARPVWVHCKRKSTACSKLSSRYFMRGIQIITN